MPGVKSALCLGPGDIQLIEASSLDEALKVGLTRESNRQGIEGRNAAQR
jgi:hypothetical protein